MTDNKAIVSILQEQINTYNMLLELLKKEKASLVEIDVEKMEEISKEKDTVVMRLRLLEKERVRLMRIFADDNYITKNMNLEDLAKFTGDTYFLCYAPKGFPC